MTFRPDPNDEIQIADVTFHVGEHPAAPGMPYGQEGRAAVVYQLVGTESRRAFKVFKPRFRVPSLVALTAKLAGFAGTPGLSVCRRTVLTPQQHGALLRTQPDLVYSVLMAWVEGPTWLEVLLDQRELSEETSLSLARSMSRVLAAMEERGLAHCDISGPNLLVPALARAPMQGTQFAVELVDVEQMYGPGLAHPEVLPAGSQGYAHKSAAGGLWSPQADRFAGAVLIAEMLGMCDARVRNASWGENYFDPDEMQLPSESYNLLAAAISDHWGANLPRLLDRAWWSETLNDCPTLAEWESVLANPSAEPAILIRSTPLSSTVPVEKAAQKPQRAESLVQMLVTHGESLQAEGDHAGALATYYQARSIAAEDEPVYALLAQRIASLENRGAGSPIRQEASTPIANTSQVTHQGVPQPQPQLIVQYPPPTQKPAPPPTIDQHAAYFDRLYDQSSAAYNEGDLRIASQLLHELVRQQPGYHRQGRLATSLLAEVEENLSAADHVRNTKATKPRAGKQASGGSRTGLVIAIVVAVLLLAGAALFMAAALKTRPASALPAYMAYAPADLVMPRVALPIPSSQGHLTATFGSEMVSPRFHLGSNSSLSLHAYVSRPQLMYNGSARSQNKHALEIV